MVELKKLGLSSSNYGVPMGIFSLKCSSIEAIEICKNNPSEMIKLATSIFRYYFKISNYNGKALRRLKIYSEDDAVQDIITYWLEVLPQYNGSTLLITFMMNYGKYRLLEAIKSGKKHNMKSCEGIEIPYNWEPPQLDFDIIVDRIQSKNQKRAIKLHFKEDKSMTEIALDMGISVQAVSKHISNFLDSERLKLKLEA